MTAGELALWLGLGVGLLVVSGFFSGSEVALFGLRRVEREQLGNSGRAVDRLVLKLIGAPKRLVVSVLIGTDLVNMTLAALATWLFMAFVVRISSLSALTAAALTPLFAWGFGMRGIALAAVLFMVALLVWRHRSNIQNLLAGAEDKIGTDRPEG